MRFYALCPLCLSIGRRKVPPLCKGRWLAKRDGGIVKVRFSIKQSLTAYGGAPFTQGSLFMFIYDSSIFLTSTAFVDTNANMAYLLRDMPYF